MWLTLKRKTMECVILVLLSFSFVSLQDCGICSAAPNTEETLTVSKQDWITLQRNNAEQKKALEESEKELTEAKKALDESQTALSVAVNLLEASEMTLDESQEKLILLLKEYEAQKQEIARLKNELAMFERESATASDALKKANQFLQDTREEIKENERRHAEIEGALKNRITAWQIVSALLAGYAIVK